MLTCNLKGGLGNQMFQISAVLNLAIKNNDVCGFNFIRHRIINQGYDAIKYTNNVFNKLKNQYVVTYNIYNEESFEYRKIPYSQNLMINGYFQSEKYFIENKDVIINLFTNEEIIERLSKNFNNILENSVSLHIRRGDYIKYSDTHNLLDIDYYNNALKILIHKILPNKINNILVFSDDITYCKNNIKDDRIFYVDDLEDYEQMYLMSLCNHNIISNSTFSWWGSYLNKNDNKIIIAPKMWFNEKTNILWDDIYTENMIII